VLQLKPWEFERLDVMELEKLERGFNDREKYRDQKAAFLTTILANVHLKKGIDVKDLMRSLHPPTKVEKIKQDIVFKREWKEAEEVVSDG